MADAAGQAAVHLAAAVPLLPGSTLPLCSSGAGPASAWCSCHPDKMILITSQHLYTLHPHLETVGECVILELIRQTLAQSLTGPGVVRQAEVTANLERRSDIRHTRRQYYSVLHLRRASEASGSVPCSAGSPSFRESLQREKI